MSKRSNTQPMKRCAIYTRKSCEEGLEQEFNSLDAQWEAGAAYVMSQKHQGWVLVDERFEDGGYSGGNIERPGLKRLVAAVERDEIDIIIVYKVDRLTRSISDFARLVDVLDAHKVSFISVTQPLNTTDSMGRLTLHMLLSFAQFEREITSERIRDKIAESKKKGMWMGGQVPLGYNTRDRKLVVNLGEKEVVRQIFETFIETRSISGTCYRINEMGFRTKVYKRRDGSFWGGRRYGRATLDKILKNRIYLGLIHHKGEWFPGKHDAIIDQSLWDKAEAIYTQYKENRRSEYRRNYQPAVLKGLIYGPDGRALTPASGLRRGKRFRYYTSSTAIKEGYKYKIIPPLPAEQLERQVIQEVERLLVNPELILQVYAQGKNLEPEISHDATREALHNLQTIWKELFPPEQQRIVRLLIQRIDVTKDSLRIRFHCAGLPSITRGMSGGNP